MSKKKLAKVYYGDLWGLREEKYKNLLKSDIQTTKWKKLKPLPPYYFFVPKDFALQAEYEKFWKVTEVFREWSSGVKTHRDHFVVGFSKEEIIQRLRIFKGNMPDELVSQSLNLKDTGTWNLNEARKKIKEQRPEDEIYFYSYRPFDVRWICYDSSLIERDRKEVMSNILNRENLGLNLIRRLRDPIWEHVYITSFVTNKDILSLRDNSYFFPLYLYPEKSKSKLYKAERISNFSPAFVKAIEDSLNKKPSSEEIFYYIYAILYCPIYRKRYEEFLKIDFPRIPLPSNYRHFQKLSKLGQELIDLHLLKHPALSSIEISFPKGGSNKVEKVRYEEKAKRLHINKDQYFANVIKDVWEYRIGAYQVMEKYLKDRKGRKLSLDEINHYLKIAKAIRLTMEIQKKIDKIK